MSTPEEVKKPYVYPPQALCLPSSGEEVQLAVPLAEEERHGSAFGAPEGQGGGRKATRCPPEMYLTEYIVNYF